MPAVTLNGDERRLSEGATALDAVRESGVPGVARGVAVAVDGEVVPRSDWERTPLADGARVEVLQAVQGG